MLRHTRDGIALRPGTDGARTRLGGPPLLPAGQRSGRPRRTATSSRSSARSTSRSSPAWIRSPATASLALYWNREWGGKGEGKKDFVAATRAFYLKPGDRASEPEAPAKTLPITYKPLRGAAMPIAGDPELVAEELRGQP